MSDGECPECKGKANQRADGGWNCPFCNYGWVENTKGTPIWVAPTAPSFALPERPPMSGAMKAFGIISAVFLSIIFPPFLIVVIIWGIVTLVNKK